MTARILVVGTAPDAAVALRPGLSPPRYAVDRALSTADMIAALRAAPPDLILVEDVAGRALSDIRTIRAQDGADGIPVVALMSPGARDATRLDLFEAGADEVLRRPVPERLLTATIRTLRRAADQARETARRRATAAEFGFSDAAAPSYAPPPRVVRIGRDDARRRALSQALGAPVAALDEAEALARAAADRPAEAYLIDATGEGGEPGLSTLSELRTQSAVRRAAILVLADAPDIAAEALGLGATAVLPGSASGAEVALRLRRAAAAARDRDRLARAMEASIEAAVTDPLTGVRNRRYAERHADQLFEDAAAAGRPIAVLVVDIDHFKQVNDRHGHAAGDIVLAEVARRLGDSLRGGDLLARIGGEEFLLVLQGAGCDQATTAAQRLRMQVSGTPVALPDGGAVHVTISIGICASGPTGPSRIDRTHMTAEADRACYAAKRAGRNRAEMAPAGRAA